MIKIKRILIFTIIFVIVFSSITFADSFEDLPPFPIDLYELACEIVGSYNPYYVLYKQEGIYKLGFLKHNDVYSNSSSVYTRSDNYVALFLLGETGWYRYYLEPFRPAGNTIGFTPTRGTIKLNSNFTIYNEQGDLEVFPYNPLPSNFFTVPPHKVVEMEMRGVVPDLVGQILTILPVGFGVLSLMLLIVLLVGFWKFYSRRLI